MNPLQAASLSVEETCISEAVQESWNHLGEVGCTWTKEQLSSVKQHYESLEKRCRDVGRLYSEVQGIRKKVRKVWNCKLFVWLLISGLTMMCLACTVAQPFLFVYPWIFAALVSMGGLQIMAALFSLVGRKRVLKPEQPIKRVLLGGFYWLSVFATLYSAIAMKSCILCLCLAFLQVISLLWYLVSCLSGGFEAVLSCFRKIYDVYELFHKHLWSFNAESESN